MGDYYRGEKLADGRARIRFQVPTANAAIALDLALLLAAYFCAAQSRSFWLASDPAQRKLTLDQEALLHFSAAFWAGVDVHSIYDGLTPGKG
jgi:hypothetical protein